MPGFFLFTQVKMKGCLIQSGLNRVRAEEARFYPEMMKGSRYAFLKNPENLIKANRIFSGKV